MKLPKYIYIIFVVLGLVLTTLGGYYEYTEYSTALGFVLLMYGLYKISTQYVKPKEGLPEQPYNTEEE
ncbi:hypothetical protein [Sediminicola luteus]|uniref:Uncharacterized protein n=1 Tax=Sediminicola luteus TaxID=319238 RepID=A0A2A4GAU5_9FLAO|nr:hypothetical protein [Sediminicola luteus]PCE64885.1 hypothetical protein B7P33_06900 [Sediminicola luteus]